MTRKPRVAARIFALIVALALAGACGLAKSPGEAASESLQKGVEAHNAGRIDEAIRLYYEALAREPKTMLALHNLGQIARAQNRVFVAQGYYQQALDIDGNFAPSLFGLAIIRSGQPGVLPQEPIALYRAVIALEPNNAAAHYNLGLLLRVSGQVAEGEAAIAKARQLDPSLGAPGPAPTPATAAPTVRPSPTTR